MLLSAGVSQGRLASFAQSALLDLSFPRDGARDPELHRVELVIGEAGIHRAAQQDAEVELPGLQRLPRAVRRASAQVHGDHRVLGSQGRDHLADAACGGLAAGAHDEVALELATDHARKRRELGGFVEQGLGLPKHHLAGTRQLEAAVGADEELGVEVVLHRSDVGAGCRLADVKPFGGAGEVLLLGDRHESAQLDKVDQHGRMDGVKTSSSSVTSSTCSSRCAMAIIRSTSHSGRPSRHFPASSSHVSPPRRLWPFG